MASMSDQSAIRPGADLRPLVAAALDGDATAWNHLVDRFAPLVWGICRGYRLSEADAGDVCQTVWLRMVERLASIRQPEALAGWIVTTTRRECLHVATRGNKGEVSVDALERRPADGPAPDAALLDLERRDAVREAFTEIPENCQRLLAILITADQVSYTEVSERLGMPLGSIGPTRARCLDKLRAAPSLAAWLAPTEGNAS
jgi:RNA polymerase sigma factor (sigma-70 family)